MLFIYFQSIAQEKDSIKPVIKDSIVFTKGDVESIINYSAEDSIYADFKKEQLHLYGSAHINYEGVDMRAAYILVDKKSNEIFATHLLDSAGKMIGKPVFVDGTDTIVASSLRYNTETKKAYIKQVAIHQDEIYLTMETAKRQLNENIHFINGKFTTCNLEEPHFHFFLSKGVLVPEKRIATGPMNLWVMGVPTPLGLPFSFIPQRKKKDKERLKGFLMPQIITTSAYGFGLQELGYYIPVNDQFQTTLYGMIYSRGSFGLRAENEYYVKYRFKGRFDAGYQYFREGFPQVSKALPNYSLAWIHEQDPKANPNWNFGSNINFKSNGTNKQTLNPQSSTYFDNTLNSDLRLSKRFGKLPMSASLKASLRQNSTSKLVNLTSPDFNFNVTRFNPFKRKNRVGKERFYEQIGMVYNFDAVNRSDFSDTLLSSGNLNAISGKFRNGFRHSTSVQQTFNFVDNIIRFTPSLAYSQQYNFQTIERSIVDSTNKAITDTLARGAITQRLTMTAGFTSSVYSYYRFIGKRKTLMRHVATPSISFSYIPAIQQGVKSYTDTNGREIKYSVHESSIYSEGVSKASGLINFGLQNTFELKRKSTKDTITGFVKSRIIESLQLGTSYDIFKDSMNWSDLSIGMLLNPAKSITINIRGNYSWYGWNDSTGVRSSKYALQTNQGLGRLTNFSAATSWSLTSKKNRDALAESNRAMSTTWNPMYQSWMMLPTQFIDFSIPWKLNLNHVLSFDLNDGNVIDYSNRKYRLTNTLSLNGDVSITENWKIAATTYLDGQTGKITNTNLNLYRNLHCWNMQFTWTPIGTNKSFLIAIKANANMLNNANFNIRKPPLLF